MDNGSATVPRITTEDGYTASSVWQTPATDPTRSQALHALQSGERMVYAMRLPDGVIKVGSTVNLPNRASSLHGEILAFRPGGFPDELAIHNSLKAHRARGREYYRPTDEVLAVVNDLRTYFDLPPIAA